jgi:hypothetical protein
MARAQDWMAQYQGRLIRTQSLQGKDGERYKQRCTSSLAGKTSSLVLPSFRSSPDQGQQQIIVISKHNAGYANPTEHNCSSLLGADSMRFMALGEE